MFYSSTHTEKYNIASDKAVYCVFQQPRKTGNHPDMTEQLLTVT